MQPPQGISMQPILQALALRQAGHLGGGGTPMAQQASTPTHSLPGGGSTSPVQANPQTPNSPAGSMPSQVQQGAGQNPTNQALQAGQQSQGPMFDQETRDLAKSLVQRLLKGI